MLKQSRKLHAEATDFYRRVIEIRTDKLINDRAGLAQAFVSLGVNLLKDQQPADMAQERYREALPLLEEALGHYLAAFHKQHPKVAHGHAAIAECCGRLGEYDRAEHHLGLAEEIRTKMGDERGLLELRTLNASITAQRKVEERPGLANMSSKGKMGSLWKRHTMRDVLVAGGSGGSAAAQAGRAGAPNASAEAESARAATNNPWQRVTAQLNVAKSNNSFFELVLAARRATAEAQATADAEVEAAEARVGIPTEAKRATQLTAAEMVDVDVAPQ